MSAEAPAQSGRGNEPPAQGGAFPWLFAPAKRPTTLFVSEPERVWRRDAVREERKEREYQQLIRTAEEKAIRERNRTELQTALRRAAARAQALRSFAESSAKRQADGPSTNLNASGSEGPSSRPAGKPGESFIPGPVGEIIEAARKEARETFNTMSNAIADAVEIAPAGASGARSSGAFFFLVLLAIFLVPAFAIALLLLAFIHLRNGHRLQSAVFALAGCAVAAILLGTRHEMRGADRATDTARLERLREECRSSSVQITGYVHEAAAEGVVLTDVSGVDGDEHGWIVVITTKRSASGGERWTFEAFPVGSRKAQNAIGATRELPAYADSLDLAVAARAEAEDDASAWWWERLLRSLDFAQAPSGVPLPLAHIAEPRG